MPLPRMIRRTCLCIHATPAQPGWSVFCRHVSRFLFGLATLSPCFPSPLMFSFWVFLFNSSWSCLFPLVGKPSQAKSELDSPCGVSVAFSSVFSLFYHQLVSFSKKYRSTTFFRVGPFPFSFFCCMKLKISVLLFFLSAVPSRKRSANPSCGTLIWSSSPRPSKVS